MTYIISIIPKNLSSSISCRDYRHSAQASYLMKLSERGKNLSSFACTVVLLNFFYNTIDQV